MKCETRFQENKGNRASINISSWWESSNREGQMGREARRDRGQRLEREKEEKGEVAGAGNNRDTTA